MYFKLNCKEINLVIAWLIELACGARQLEPIHLCPLTKVRSSRIQTMYGRTALGKVSRLQTRGNCRTLSKCRI